MLDKAKLKAKASELHSRANDLKDKAIPLANELKDKAIPLAKELKSRGIPIAKSVTSDTCSFMAESASYYNQHRKKAAKVGAVLLTGAVVGASLDEMADAIELTTTETDFVGRHG